MSAGDSQTFEVAGSDGSLKTYELKLTSIDSKVLDKAPSGPRARRTRAGRSKHHEARKPRDQGQRKRPGRRAQEPACQAQGNARRQARAQGPGRPLLQRLRARRLLVLRPRRFGGLVGATTRLSSRSISLGLMALRFTTAGESHGPGLVAVLEGLPAGLELTPEDIDRDLARRQLGHGRGGRMKIESDRAIVWGGIRHGRTLGSPIALLIENRDYANWEERMNPWPVDADDRRGAPATARATPTSAACSSTATPTCATCSSARAPARRRRGSLPGRWPRCFLREVGVERAQPRAPDRLGAGARARHRCRRRTSRASTSRRFAASTSRRREAMVAEIDSARKANESLGGVFEVRAFGLVPGLGSYVSVGHPPGGPARAGDDVDPRDQGRRDRRRLRRRRARRLEGARRDLLGRVEGLRARDQPRRWPRGWHDHRRAGRGARRDEAAADADEAAALGGHRDASSRPRPCASAPTPAPCRPPAWSERRWWRSRSPTPTARSSAATP